MSTRNPRAGDTVRCPSDGQPERVTRVWRVGALLTVRTNRHDHVNGARLQVIKRSSPDAE